MRNKPTPKELAEATSTVWDVWDCERTLDEGYRDVNGVERLPGEFTLRELLAMLYDVVSCWHERNFGVYAARQFLANLVSRDCSQCSLKRRQAGPASTR
jgi:hypothetical protein